jgi:hypothetical protein
MKRNRTADLLYRHRLACPKCKKGDDESPSATSRNDAIGIKVPSQEPVSGLSALKVSPLASALENAGGVMSAVCHRNVVSPKRLRMGIQELNQQTGSSSRWRVVELSHSSFVPQCAHGLNASRPRTRNQTRHDGRSEQEQGNQRVGHRIDSRHLVKKPSQQSRQPSRCHQTNS